MGYTEINLQDPKVPAGHPAIAILAHKQAQLLTVDMPDSTVSHHYTSYHPAAGTVGDSIPVGPAVWHTDYTTPPAGFKPNEIEPLARTDQIIDHTHTRPVSVTELHQLFGWLQDEAMASPQDKVDEICDEDLTA